MEGMCALCYEKVFGENFFAEKEVEVSEKTCPVCKEGKVITTLVTDLEGNSISCSQVCGNCNSCGSCGKH